MTPLIFFYGTLMRAARQPGRDRADVALEPLGRGWIRAALFDIGPYPAAVPADGGRVWGELYRVSEPITGLQTLDDIEGCDPDDPDSSLYNRLETEVTREDGDVVTAWAYFYNRPLDAAPRIESGDYLHYLKEHQ